VPAAATTTTTITTRYAFLHLAHKMALIVSVIVIVVVALVPTAVFVAGGVEMILKCSGGYN